MARIDSAWRLMGYTHPANPTRDAPQLLTLIEVGRYLEIESLTTVALLLRRAGAAYERHGDSILVPLTEIARLRVAYAEVIAGLQASDRMHEATALLGAPEGLTQEQMDDLAEARPGTVPWA